MHCQNCQIPLQLDKTLDQLNPVSYGVLSNASNAKSSLDISDPFHTALIEQRNEYFQAAASEAKESGSGPTYTGTATKDKKAVELTASLSKDELAAMSFVMLSESQLDSTASVASARDPQAYESTLMSSQMRLADRIFEILSARSDIDHPICTECSEAVIEGYRNRLNSAYKERNAYMILLREANMTVPDEAELSKIKTALEMYKKRYTQEMTVLENLEAEKRKLLEEIDALDEEAQELEAKEKEFWEHRNSFSYKMTKFNCELERRLTRYEHDVKQLEWLQGESVYNDTFFIDLVKPYATINGLRLGHKSEYSPTESEINAAWGQTCLLLTILAEKNDYVFQKYRLNPMGSYSTIDQFEADSQPTRSGSRKQKTYYLFYKSYSFDEATEAFLDCVRQLGEHIESRRHLDKTSPRTLSTSLSRSVAPDGTGPSAAPTGSSPSISGAVLGSVSAPSIPKITIQVVRDRINGASIKHKSSRTDACWHMLKYCKYLLALTSRYNTVMLGPESSPSVGHDRSRTSSLRT